MVKREFTFPSADGKTAIHAVEWLPEGAPRAVLQIAHGVSEYVLRYEGTDILRDDTKQLTAETL